MQLETSLTSRRPTYEHLAATASSPRSNRKKRERVTNMPRRTRTEDAVYTPDEGSADDAGTGTQSGAASSGTSSVAGGVVDSAKEAANQAKEAASHVIDQAKDKAASRADQQRRTAASGFEAVAHAFRSMGDDLRNREQGPVAEYAAELGHTIGGQVERLANYLRDRDVHRLVSDAEDFARRSPAVFLGSAFALGLAASRFLKSSRPAPDPFENMPDPNRALPPASGASTGSAQPYEGRLSTPEDSGAQWKTTARVRSRSTASSASFGSDEPGTSGTHGSGEPDEPTGL
jgi:hypothetical protein